MFRTLVQGILFAMLAVASAGCIGGTLSTVPFHEEPAQSSYALIYIYRLHGFAGGGNAWEVALDDNVIGRIRPKAYFTIHAAPGTHWLRVGNEQPFSLSVALTGVVGTTAWAVGRRTPHTDEFKAKSGEVYYLRLAGREHAFLSRDEAIGELREMKYDWGD